MTEGRHTISIIKWIAESFPSVGTRTHIFTGTVFINKSISLCLICCEIKLPRDLRGVFRPHGKPDWIHVSHRETTQGQWKQFREKIKSCPKARPRHLGASTGEVTPHRMTIWYISISSMNSRIRVIVLEIQLTEMAHGGSKCARGVNDKVPESSATRRVLQLKPSWSLNCWTIEPTKPGKSWTIKAGIR